MDQKLDRKLVRSVSRSFSLTLQLLPKSHRSTVTLTYLLARLADTITDSGRWSADQRLKHLTSWEAALVQKNKSLWKLDGSLGTFSEKEAQLLLLGGDLIEEFLRLAPQTQHLVEEVLKILVSGMRWDLKTFATSGPETPVRGCDSVSIFDWYCYAIAGCVGSFWVNIFNLPRNFENLATEYGKGLQRINILRDVVEDFGRGRVYLPIDQLSAHGVDGNRLWRDSKWFDFVKSYIAETRRLLLYGANFCDAIPYTEFRLRWASRLPLVIGLKTLDRLESLREWPDAPVKISRREVRGLVLKSLVDVFLSRKLTGRIL